MTAAELETYGRHLAHQVNNPAPHHCVVDAATCAAYDTERDTLRRRLAAARAEWARRAASSTPHAA